MTKIGTGLDDLEFESMAQSLEMKGKSWSSSENDLGTEMYTLTNNVLENLPESIRPLNVHFENDISRTKNSESEETD